MAALYLIPGPLGDESQHCLLPDDLAIVQNLTVFIVEKAKTARKYLKTWGIKTPLREVTFFELNKHTKQEELSEMLTMAREGHDIGLLSEAGCPGIADPGADIVHLAHKRNIVVKPMIGPSSLLLALMGAGMNGQSFAFCGYLPVKSPERKKAIKNLGAKANHQTQMFIETPYRNMQMLEDLIQTLDNKLSIAIATDLTLPTELIVRKYVHEWKKLKSLPDLHKRPTVFLIG